MLMKIVLNFPPTDIVVTYVCKYKLCCNISHGHPNQQGSHRTEDLTDECWLAFIDCQTQEEYVSHPNCCFIISNQNGQYWICYNNQNGWY